MHKLQIVSPETKPKEQITKIWLEPVIGGHVVLRARLPNGDTTNLVKIYDSGIVAHFDDKLGFRTGASVNQGVAGL